MKKTVSIMLLILMFIASTVLSAFAEELPIDTTGDTAPTEEIVQGEGEPFQELTDEAPKEEQNQEPVLTTPQDEDLQDIDALSASYEDLGQGSASITWNGLEGATYSLILDEQEPITGITELGYILSDLNPGTHVVKVVATAPGLEEGDNDMVFESVVNFEVADYIGNVESVMATSGYGSVSIHWTPVENAVQYILTKATSADSENLNSDHPYKTFAADSLTLINEPLVGYKYKDSNSGTMTYYKVYAVSEGGAVSSVSPCASDTRVEYIRYNFVLKKKKKLKSHNPSGKQKTVTFKKGTKLTSDGFGGGKYKFYKTIGGKKYLFYCKSVDTKSNSAIYDKKNNYTRYEAENYVNEHNYSSSTKYLIWASLYTQHVYIFKGSKGKWECIRDFECGSGSAKYASPSGTDKKLISGPGTEKKPGKKKSRHNRKYWSPFSSWNSFHARKKGQTLGYPASKGCIRSLDDDAYYIYKSVPVKTKVVVL